MSEWRTGHTDTKENFLLKSVFGKSFHFAQGYAELGEILQQIYSLTKEEKTLSRAIEAYKNAAAFHRSSDLPTQVAESCWRVAQFFDMQGIEHSLSKSFYDFENNDILRIRIF